MAVKILVMGGTRFIGKPLVAQLLAAGHQLTLFTRGRQPLPEGLSILRATAATPPALSRCAAAPST